MRHPDVVAPHIPFYLVVSQVTQVVCQVAIREALSNCSRLFSAIAALLRLSAIAEHASPGRAGEGDVLPVRNLTHPICSTGNAPALNQRSVFLENASSQAPRVMVTPSPSDAQPDAKLAPASEVRRRATSKAERT
eukprot:CAMPEP_0198360462 /NCGR_PEP_ID=MMETSP1450-20131203/138487_1 /TAXON_ID=753684 ORGANISM="Madagascaria erythrocladiodes, Strain CCMP3234" /NCGR_SAMPLE_ID=MMETSP1450 /ASSEMBLY_ACC=CAM_ASM_001115 /LENGTH=134 /DNA_ID=CAMNT_0044067475 /DNA_START=564 /DNA_END=969 /DNA_ORIENTATION=-